MPMSGEQIKGSPHHSSEPFFFPSYHYPHPVSPCGACRQVLAEYEKLGGEKLEIILYGDDEIYVLSEVSDLLPLIFDEAL